MKISLKRPKFGSKKWTEVQKELLGYKRRLATLSKDSVSLSSPPWEQGEQHGDEYVEERREGMEVSSEEQTSRKRRGSKRV